MAKVAIFLDHDYAVRHFILNGVLPSLESEHDVVFIFPENHRRVTTDLKELDIGRYRTIKVSEGRAYLYRRLYQTSVLRRMRETDDKEVVFTFWRRALGPKYFRESWLRSWPVTYQIYRWAMLARIGENPALNELLEQERPDIIIHPSVLEGLFVSDLVKWGKKNGTPTVFVMNSWDNPAVKAMMVGYPDRLAVWGEQTKDHAIRHMGMPAEKVVCLGAAQFDLYRRPPLETPEEFKRRRDYPTEASSCCTLGPARASTKRVT